MNNKIFSSCIGNVVFMFVKLQEMSFQNKSFNVQCQHLDRINCDLVIIPRISEAPSELSRCMNRRLFLRVVLRQLRRQQFPTDRIENITAKQITGNPS